MGLIDGHDKKVGSLAVIEQLDRRFTNDWNPLFQMGIFTKNLRLQLLEQLGFDRY